MIKFIIRDREGKDSIIEGDNIIVQGGYAYIEKNNVTMNTLDLTRYSIRIKA